MRPAARLVWPRLATAMAAEMEALPAALMGALVDALIAAVMGALLALPLAASPAPARQPAPMAPPATAGVASACRRDLAAANWPGLLAQARRLPPPPATLAPGTAPRQVLLAVLSALGHARFRRARRWMGQTPAESGESLAGFARWRRLRWYQRRLPLPLAAAWSALLLLSLFLGLRREWRAPEATLPPPAPPRERETA